MADSKLDAIATDWATLQPMLTQLLQNFSTIQGQVASLNDPRAAEIANAMSSEIAVVGNVLNQGQSPAAGPTGATGATGATGEAGDQSPAPTGGTGA